MDIEFLEDYEVKAAGGATYKAGQRVTLPTSSARHFIKRGRAKIAGTKSVGGNAGKTKPAATKETTKPAAEETAESKPETVETTSVDKADSNNMQRSKPITANGDDGLERSKARGGKRNSSK